MNLLDIRTVVFSQLITDALCTVVLIFLWLQNLKRYKGMIFWIVDFICQTAGILLVMLRGSIPDWVSVGFSTPLIIAGAYMGYLGLERFVGKRSSQLYNYILLVIFGLVHIYFTQARPDLDARNLNFSIGLFVICIQCAWLMLRRDKRGRTLMSRMVGLVFELFCLVSLIRIIIIVANPQPNNDFFQSGLYETLILIVFQSLLILLTFSLALMVNWRLLGEVKTEEEKFTKAFHSSPYAIVITRHSDGVILDVNRVFEEVTGYLPSEAVGKTTLDLRLWVNEADLQQTITEMSAMGEVQGKEYQFRTKSGEHLTGLYYAEMLPLEDEQLVLSSISDITESKRAEAMTRESEERYRSLFENMLNGFAYCKMIFEEKDAKDFIYLNVNRVFETLTGLKDVVGKPVSEVIPGIRETDPELLEIYARVALTGQPEVFETYVVALEMWFSISVYSPEKGFFVAVFDVITERKLAEAALLESEARYRHTLDAMLEGCQIIGFDWRYLYLNDVADQHNRRPKEELLGKIYMEMWPGVETKQVFAAMQRCMQERLPQSMENKFVFPDGKSGWFELRIYPVPEGIVIFSIDITEHKLAEETRKESEENFRALAENAGEGVLIAVEGGIHLFANRASAEITGYSVDELLHLNARELAHPDESPKIMERLKKRLAGETIPNRYETTILSKQGLKIPVEISSNRTIWKGQPADIVFMQDITARKQAENAIRESEEKFRKAFYTSPDAININRLADGMYVSINNGFSQIMGYGPEEAIGKTSLELDIWANPEDRKALVQGLTKSGGVVNLEARFRAKNGDIHYGLMSASVFELDNIPHIISITRDMTEKKRSEVIIRESEERYRTVADYTYDWETWRVQDGRYLYVSPSCERISGYRVQDFMDDASLLDRIVHPEDRVLYEEHQLLVAQDEDEGKVHQMDFRILRRDGETRWIGHTCQLIRRADGTPLGRRATNRDITENKRAEQVINSLAKFPAENPSAIMRIQQDGTLLYANESSLKMLIEWKLKAGEPAPPILQDLVAESLAAGVGKTIDTVHGDRVISFYVAPIVDTGYANLYGRDVTEERQAEQALVESEARFRSAVQESPFPMMIHAEDGEVIEINRVWSELTGYTHQDIPTISDWTERAYGIRKKAIQPDIDRLYGIKERFAEGEYSITCKDGTQHVWDFTSAPLGYLPDGRRFVMSSASDVTERKQAEEEVQRLNDSLDIRVKERTVQLEAANQELEAFAYSVSHDLRAPLRGIDGWSLALLEDYRDRLDEQGQVYLERVRSETQRMGQLIDDLLHLSRVTRAEMRINPVDMSALAQTVVARLRAAQPDRQVEIIIQPGLTASGDADLLAIVLTNLFDNAWKFTEKLPDVCIEFGQVDVDGHPAFFVRDNGVGFDMTYSQKLFGAFQRMHKASEFPGTGIGLATVQRIIHRHGGRVWAHAQVDQGATFYFTLEEVA